MKKLIITIIILINASSCMIMNPLGLQSGRIKGDKAGQMITDSAINRDLVNSTLFYGRTYVSVFSLIAGSLANIDKDKYYLKSDVDKCVSAIDGFDGFMIGSTLTILLTSACEIKPDHAILDSPFPEI